MATRMDRGATDTTVTELLTGVDFHNVKNDACRRDGFVKSYKNGYNRVRICRLWLCSPQWKINCLFVFCRNIWRMVYIRIASISKMDTFW